MSVCLPICLFVCLSVCLSIFSICLSVYLFVSLSVYLSVCLSVCLSIHRLSTCLSVHLFIHLFVCLSLYTSGCLPVFLSSNLSIFLSVRLAIYVLVCLSICPSSGLPPVLSQAPGSCHAPKTIHDLKIATCPECQQRAKILRCLPRHLNLNPPRVSLKSPQERAMVSPTSVGNCHQMTVHPPPPRGNSGYCTRAQSGRQYKRRKKCGSSVA